MFSTLVKMGLIGVTVVASVAARAEDITPGKYFCFVTHMAGIQPGPNGQIVSGNFKPAVEKFFIDIHDAIHPSDLCKTDNSELDDWYLCKARFEAQIDNGRRLRGDQIGSFISGFPFNEHFVFFADGSFDAYQTVISSGGFFVSDGKCTKL